MMRPLKLIGIIGDPIEQTLSPKMQNAAFRRANLPFVYLPFRVRPQELEGFLQKAPSKGIVGLNVTIPHKEKIIRHLDRISPEARAIGAVNTVVYKKNGIAIGANTDAIGFLRSLRDEAGLDPKGKKIMILGAGGAARAVLYALARAGAGEIWVSNRTDIKAARLVRKMQKGFPKAEIRSIPFRTKDLQKILPQIELLVNATSVGLNGTCLRTLPLSSLSRRAVVSDLVYRPLMTPLLQEAKKKGFKIHTGLGMLLHQGAESFRLWTGKNPDLAVMKKASGVRSSLPGGGKITESVSRVPVCKGSID